MDTKKLLPCARVDPGFGERAEYMASAEREPILGIRVLYLSGVQWQLAPGGVSAGAKPPEADEFSVNDRSNFLIQFISNMVKYSSH